MADFDLKLGRKKEDAIVALVSQRSIEDREDRLAYFIPQFEREDLESRSPMRGRH